MCVIREVLNCKPGRVRLMFEAFRRISTDGRTGTWNGRLQRFGYLRWHDL